MNIYPIDVRVYATAYLRAGSEAEALAKAHKLKNATLELPSGEYGDVEISGRQFDDPDLPDVSLSPAMTIAGPSEDTENTARKDDPLTVAYMAMGAANALRERRAQFDPEQWDGENGFIAAVIEHAPMLDNLVPDDGLVAVFCYDVAEPFGYRYATAMLDGQTLDPRELGNALIAAASE